MVKTWKSGVQDAFDDPDAWQGNVAPVDGDSLVIASPNDDPPTSGDILFQEGTLDSVVVFGTLPLPVSTNTGFFNSPGQTEIMLPRC